MVFFDRWKNIMFAYNIVLSVFSLGCFLAMMVVLQRKQVLTNDCDSLFNDSLFNWTVWLFYMSKYVEYAVSHASFLRCITSAFG